MSATGGVSGDTEGPGRSEEPYWSEEEVTKALGALRAGGLLLGKGDIGYGLFGTSEPAIRTMYRAKGRSYRNPCIFIGSLAVLDEIAELPSEEARQWCARTAEWTTVAVVARARPTSTLLAGMDPWVRARAVTAGTLAVFLRTGPYLAELVERASGEGWVFVGSSANRSGTGNCYRLDDVPAELVSAADLVVDHGTSLHEHPQRLATTIVDTTSWTVRRRGVNAEAIVAGFTTLARSHGAEVGPATVGPHPIDRRA